MMDNSNNTLNATDNIRNTSTAAQIQTCISQNQDKQPLNLRKFNYKINNDLAQVHRSTSMNSIGGQHLKHSYEFDDCSIKSIESDLKIDNSSINSDIPNSVSSISDLTGYEEEFLQLKKCVKTYKTTNTSSELKNKYKNEIITYKIKIQELESLLETSREENEKNKFDLNDLETKVQMIWHEKYQELLRQKGQAELQLNHVSKKFANTIKEIEILRNNNSQSENINLHYKLKQFEVQNVELTSKLDLVQNEYKQLEVELKNSELENEKLRIGIQELKSEVDSKSTIQLGLKNKITEQHIEVQGHLQANLNLNNQISTFRNEIDAVKNSEKWYSNQLHSCQLIKSNIQQELMSNKTNLISATHDLENLKLEIETWKNLYEETHLKAIREKEKFIKKFEVLESDFIEREAVLTCTKPMREDNYFITKSDTLDKNLIQELEDEIANMNNIIKEQSTTIKNVQVQNTDYIVRLTTLQKNLNESEIQVQTLQDLNRDLEQKSNSYNENLRIKDTELLDLKTKIVNLEVGLHGASREKDEIDEVVKSLRHDFNKFMKCYNLMKEKVEEKARLIAQVEQEKQELFMENNWKICEIERLQQMVLDRKSLQADLIEMTNLYNEVRIDKDNLKQENNDMETHNKNLNQENVVLKVKVDDLQNNLTELNNPQNKEIMLHENKELRRQISDNQSIIDDLKSKLNILDQPDFTELNDQITTENIRRENNELALLNADNQLIIKELKLELSQFDLAELNNHDEDYLKRENKDLKLRNKNYMHKIIDLESKIINLVNEDQINTSKKVTNSENEIVKLNELLKMRENQLLNQAKNVELLCNEVDSKDKSIAVLEAKCYNSEHSKIDDLTKKLSDAKCVIEQFNNLCRNSEMEKNHLSLELKLLKTNKCSFLNKEVQTDFEVLDFNSIKKNLFELISDNNNNPDVLIEINNYLKTIPNLKTRTNENSLDELELKLKLLQTRCTKLDNNYNLISKVIELVPKSTFKPNLDLQTIGIQTHIEVQNEQFDALLQETKDLKTLLRVKDAERKVQYKRFETNNRTLLRKVKEHMRGRKCAEKHLLELDDTYKLAISELNNLKLSNNRLEVEVKTFRYRCDEYKSICDKLNSEIRVLEEEKINENLHKSNECLKCLDKASMHEKFVTLNDEKLLNYEQQIKILNRELLELKKLYFNEKLKCSALQKQVSSVQMCLENANEQLDNKKIELSGLKIVEDKLKLNIKSLEAQLDYTSTNYQECKRQLDETIRILDETNAKDEILADEIKTLSCHLHQKSLDIANLENKFTILETKSVLQATNYENTIQDLKQQLSELQIELTTVRNDKFFLQRLSADLKMSLQGTVNQNKVLKHRLEVLENNSKNVSLENLAYLTKIDEEHINNLLRQSTNSPEKPLKNLRSCLDSLKQEMVSLQKEIHIKTQIDLI